MTLEEKVQYALSEAQKAEDYTNILNAFSAHLYCYRAQKQHFEIENFWARERDDLVYADAKGRKAVVEFYCTSNQKMRDEKLRLAHEFFPQIQIDRENDGVGDMVAKAAALPYVVIADDGLSAHGVWFVPGLCCEIGKDGKVKANYFQEKNAVDFVKEGEEWKILRLDIYLDFITPAKDIDFDPAKYEFDLPGGIDDYAPVYSAVTIASFNPPLPAAYETWSDDRAFRQAY